MLSLAQPLYPAQGSIDPAPPIPTKETLLWWMDRNRNADGTFSKTQNWLADHLRMSRMTVHRWMKELASDNRLKDTGQWRNRSRVYALLSAPRKPVASENVTSHVTSQVASFQKFPKALNRDSKERSAPSPETKPDPETVTGEWLWTREHVEARTGQRLRRWQLGYLSRECHRQRIEFWRFCETITRHPIEQSRNAFAVLLQLIRNLLHWPKKQPKEPPRRPFIVCSYCQSTGYTRTGTCPHCADRRKSC